MRPGSYHLMGIGGVGMSALAEALAYLGHPVSGCDQNPAAGDRLRAAGIPVQRGHDPSHLAGVDRLVVSSAIPPDHPEPAQARALGLEVRKRIEVLGELMAERPSLGVSGTHGKTTTTAMLAAILEAAGLDPLALVGARVPGWGGGFRPGRGPVVAEVDESDRDFPRARATLALLTNLEDDHVGGGQATYHPTPEALRRAVAEWLLGAETVVWRADWPGLSELVPPGRGLGFGFESGEVRAERPRLLPGEGRFRLVLGERELGEVRVPLPGRHNLENALAAAAAALAYGVEFPAIHRGLSGFKGTGRRLELVGTVNGARVYDDYAHHPTEVAAALRALKELGGRVRVVFQPHRYLRTARFMERFAKALALADEAVVLEVYPAGESPIPGVSGRSLAELARRKGANARHLSWEEAVAYLSETAREGEAIVTMGAGDVGRLGRELARGSAAWR